MAKKGNQIREPEPIEAPEPGEQAASPGEEPADIRIEPAGEQVVTLIAPRGTTSVGCHGANPGDPSRVLPVDKGTGQVKVPARYAQRLIEDHGFKEL